MAQISVRPEQLMAMAQTIRNHSNRIQAAIQTIDAEMRRMNADVFSGASADDLRNRYNAMQQRLMMFAPMLNKFAAQLDEAAALFRKADATATGGAGASRATGNWRMNSVTSSSGGGLGSMDHVRAIQDANKRVNWRLW